MSEFDNTNRGAIFSNKKREKDSQPHMRGTLNVEGVEYWVSAWTSTAKSGERYQSLTVQRKDEVHNKGMEQAKQSFDSQSQQPQNFDDGSDIPFG